MKNVKAGKSNADEILEEDAEVCSAHKKVMRRMLLVSIIEPGFAIAILKRSFWSSSEGVLHSRDCNLEVRPAPLRSHNCERGPVSCRALK